MNISKHNLYQKEIGLTAWLTILLAFIHPAGLQAQLTRDDDFHARYHLNKVVMVGRHHIRSAVIRKGERRITPHKWHQWSVGDGNLTERGAMLEQKLGAFYRQWTMQEGLYGDAQSPNASQTLIYANSMQRTVETARSFAAGFSPDNPIEAEYDTTVKFGSMSPVFYDVSTKFNETLKAKVLAEADLVCYPGDFQSTIDQLEEDAQKITQVLDMKDSPACQQHDTCSFYFTNSKIILHLQWMPRILGGNIYFAQVVSSNLILQYYDMPETRGTIFGHPVTLDDLRAIGRIKDMWCFLCMGSPTVGRDVAHNLLIRIKEEMNDSTKKLSYLVGHDSNMATLVGALDIDKYELEGTPEIKTPLGGKITFEIWNDADSNAYVALNYVYQNVDQIMNMTPLSMEEPPMIHPLRIKGLKPNSDGLYSMRDFMLFLNQAIDEYDTLETFRKGDVNLDRHVDMLDAVDIIRHLQGNTWKSFVKEVADDNGDGTINESDAVSIMQQVVQNNLSWPK